MGEVKLGKAGTDSVLPTEYTEDAEKLGDGEFGGEFCPRNTRMDTNVGVGRGRLEENAQR